jgi:hypothetical protein
MCEYIDLKRKSVFFIIYEKEKKIFLVTEQLKETLIGNLFSFDDGLFKLVKKHCSLQKDILLDELENNIADLGVDIDSFIIKNKINIQQII